VQYKKRSQKRSEKIHALCIKGGEAFYTTPSKKGAFFRDPFFRTTEKRYEKRPEKRPKKAVVKHPNHLFCFAFCPLFMAGPCAVSSTLINFWLQAT
jgi:hypothetical protein